MHEGWITLCQGKVGLLPSIFLPLSYALLRIPFLSPGQSWGYIYHVRFWKEPEITFLTPYKIVWDVGKMRFQFFDDFGNPAFSIAIEIMARCLDLCKEFLMVRDQEYLISWSLPFIFLEIVPYHLWLSIKSHELELFKSQTWTSLDLNIPNNTMNLFRPAFILDTAGQLNENTESAYEVLV